MVLRMRIHRRLAYISPYIALALIAACISACSSNPNEQLAQRDVLTLSDFPVGGWMASTSEFSGSEISPNGSAPLARCIGVAKESEHAAVATAFSSHFGFMGLYPTVDTTECPFFPTGPKLRPIF